MTDQTQTTPNKALKSISAFIKHPLTIAIVCILAIALGTLLMTGLFQNPKLVVLGGIINGIGLFVLTVGSLNSSKKDKSEIIDKLAEFRDKLAEFRGEISTVKSSATSKESLHDVEQIENEFNEWAEAFIDNFESKTVERQKGEILLKETEINLSHKWRPLYQYVFEVLRLMVGAYNQKAKTRIEFKVSQLPINLFGKEAQSFQSSLVFPENTVWVIKLQILQSYRRETIPNIIINYYYGQSDGDAARELQRKGITGDFLILDIDSRRELIEPRVYMKQYVGDIKTSYSINETNYKASIKELFTTLIEYELVRIKTVL